MMVIMITVDVKTQCTFLRQNDHLFSKLRLP
jgi:hypothetical protein